MENGEWRMENGEFFAHIAKNSIIKQMVKTIYSHTITAKTLSYKIKFRIQHFLRFAFPLLKFIILKTQYACQANLF